MSSEATVHHSHKKLYLMVFLWLAILTIVEVFVPEIDLFSQFVKGLLLVILAAVKAFLVAYYFMHLNEESTWLKIIAAIPLVVIIYTVVVSLESSFR